MPRFAVILPAAGKSTRFRDKDKKVFANIDGRAVWLRAAEAFVNRNDVVQTILVVAPEDQETFKTRYGAHLSLLGVEVVSSGDLVSRFESVWTDDQLESHRDAARRLRDYVDKGFAEVGRRLRAGEKMSERDLQLFLVERMREGGLVEEEPIVAVNGNAANPHYQPSAEVSSPIAKGDAPWPATATA